MRRIGLSVVLAGVMAVSGASVASASAPSRIEASGANAVVTPAASYEWNLTNVLCYYSGGAHGYGGMTGHTKMRENGTSGTTWMRITAKYQRLYSGAWHTTQSRYVQSAHQFSNNSNWHSLTWNVGFDGSAADASHATRLYVLFEWFNPSNRIYWATRWSGSC